MPVMFSKLGVAVCEFRAEIDGRQFIGVTKESAPAQQRDNPARDFLFNANNEFKVRVKNSAKCDLYFQITLCY